MVTAENFEIKKMSLQFLVKDLNSSIDFYTKELGFKIDFLYEDFYCGLIKDGHSIHLKLSEPDVEERVNKKNNEHLDIIFSINKIEDLYKDIKHKPIEVIQPLRDMPYGYEFYITDPDGYIIAFLEEKN